MQENPSAAWTPNEGAYSAPQDRLAGGVGAGCLHPPNPALDFSGLAADPNPFPF